MWNRLQGTGAYERLNAVFRYDEGTDSFHGVVIPGVSPEYPDPPEPPAE